MINSALNHGFHMNNYLHLKGFRDGDLMCARPAARLEQPGRPGTPYECGPPGMGAGQVIDGMRPARPARLHSPGLPARARSRACSGGPGRQVGQVPVSLDTATGGGSGRRPPAPRSGRSDVPGPASGARFLRFLVSFAFLPLLADGPAGGPRDCGRDMIGIGHRAGRRA